MAAFGSGAGVVEEFDDRRGLGTIAADDGDVLPFHCTAIADGSRTVEAGRRVQFRVVPGLSGRWEAT
ncbi:MAG: cold shock domain-containing protein, partial [Acidimicrobiales bacterium]